MQREQNVLEVKDLTISFGGEHAFIAVKDISFEIAAGKTLAIVGESGSGKSLTALALMKLLPKTAAVSGSIELRDGAQTIALHTVKNSDWLSEVRGNVAGMIFQEPMSSLNPVMKIGRQLSEAILAHQPVTKQHAKEQALGWLARVQLPHPEKIYNRYPHQLSGGQKQRVMIAMAMCNNPALLIADEPTTALDVTVQAEIVKLMEELQRETGTAMIFITHDLALAATIADDMLVMYRGEVMEYGAAVEVLKHPAHPYTQALLACRPTPQHKGERLPTVEDFMQEGKDDTTLPAGEPQLAPAVGNEALLKVHDLRVWFADEKNWLGKTQSYFKAVDNVSFELKKGEILGLVGESGCGKSTLSRSLIGLLPVHKGQIFFEGKDLAKATASEWNEVRREIQMIFQDPFASLNPRMTVGDMLKEPMKVHGTVPSSELQREAKRLLELVQLPADALHRYPHQFSGGQRQRVGIARALALRPKLIICDESVSALDVSVQAQILNLLKDLQKEFSLSYLFISHNLGVVHYISDRVMVMQAGKIVEAGEATEVLHHPQQEYTKRLIASEPAVSW